MNKKNSFSATAEPNESRLDLSPLAARWDAKFSIEVKDFSELNRGPINLTDISKVTSKKSYKTSLDA